MAVHRIAKLRHEATPLSPVTSPGRLATGARTMSHEAVLGGAKAQAHNFTLKRSSAYMAHNKELTGE